MEYIHYWELFFAEGLTEVFSHQDMGLLGEDEECDSLLLPDFLFCRSLLLGNVRITFTLSSVWRPPQGHILGVLSVLC